MFGKRPIIGITKPEAKPMNLSFIILLVTTWVTGGKPRLITYDEKDNLGNIKFDGLLLGGGTDVFPGLFLKDPIENHFYDHKRDEVELLLLKLVEETHKPVFGICRGAQLMNVNNGGSLHLDISKVYEGAHYPNTILGYLFFRKRITISQESCLHRITKRKELWVNSIHNQSIDEVGESLVVTSRETNGIIQSIERPNHPFYIGVQFHPERMIHKPSFYRIFSSFIKTALHGKKQG